MAIEAINIADKEKVQALGERWSKLPSEMGFQTGVMPIDEVRAKFGQIPVPPRPKKIQPSASLDSLAPKGEALDRLVDRFPAPHDWE